LRNRHITLILLLAGIEAIFLGRALLSTNFTMPYTFHLFDAITVIAAIVVLLEGHPYLQGADWFITLVPGLVIDIGVLFATLFSPYPFFGVVRSHEG
jgi:hypothetical protein